MAQSVKNLPAKKEMQVPSLDWEDPLEKETATLSNINMCVCVRVCVCVCVELSHSVVSNLLAMQET